MYAYKTRERVRERERERERERNNEKWPSLERLRWPSPSLWCDEVVASAVLLVSGGVHCTPALSLSLNTSCVYINSIINISGWGYVYTDIYREGEREDQERAGHP